MSQNTEITVKLPDVYSMIPEMDHFGSVHMPEPDIVVGTAHELCLLCEKMESGVFEEDLEEIRVYTNAIRAAVAGNQD